MAAQIIANELEVDLYRVDLSQIISKYIGETEKNLEKIFKEASKSNAILFFDEADALFGKRSEVKDARDRYANMETSYLLQKMEEYTGITILATNLKNNMDDAFKRRLDYCIEFSYPDVNMRKKIWEVIFPKETPIDKDVDFDNIAKKIELAGGSIKNIALKSAFLAAEEGTSVTSKHIFKSAVDECRKMGKSFDNFYE